MSRRLHTTCTIYLVFSQKIVSQNNAHTRTFYLVFSLKIASRTYAHDSYILFCVLLENCVAKERKRLGQFISCSPRKMERKRTHTTCTFNHVFTKKIESPKNAHDLYNLSCVPQEIASQKNAHDSYILSCVLLKNGVTKERTRLVHFILCSPRKLCREDCTRLVQLILCSQRKLYRK